VAISLISSVLIPVGVLVAVWAIAGGTWVRRSAPFLVVAPYAIWLMTSADVYFAALAAWGVAFIALGVRRDGRGAAWLGAIGRLFLATLLFMTYGGAIFMLMPLVIVGAGWVLRRSGSFGKGTTATVVGAVTMALTVTFIWFAAGFWWFDGAEATQSEYWAGTAQFRVWNYFIFAELVVALFAVGPASFFGLTKLRDKRLWILVGGAPRRSDRSRPLTALQRRDRTNLVAFLPLARHCGSCARPTVRVQTVEHLENTMLAGWIGVQATSAIHQCNPPASCGGFKMVSCSPSANGDCVASRTATASPHGLRLRRLTDCDCVASRTATASPHGLRPSTHFLRALPELAFARALSSQGAATFLAFRRPSFLILLFGILAFPLRN
jgi:hypothetical protein